MKIGHKIRRARELKNLSQENVAEGLGMSVNGYGRIERNEVDINIEKLVQLANIFEVKPEELLTFDEKYVQNIYAEKTTNQSGNIQNYFPQELKQLYEDKIKLLEEKVAWLEKK
jgi:transcriptional regulator with XRE-family HTH domain